MSFKLILTTTLLYFTSFVIGESQHHPLLSRYQKQLDDVKNDDLALSPVAHKVFIEGFHHMLNPVLDEAKRTIAKRMGIEVENEPLVTVSHHWLTMRDGVRLSTIVLIPKSTKEEEEKRCTVLGRSPYGPTSDQLADLFMLTNGCVAVIQDQRGSFLSEGEFSLWRFDGNDGFDTIQWITAQSWSNGRVFTVGVSADACGSAALMLTAPEQLYGQLLMWGSGDGHATTFPGGAFREGLVVGWMSIMSSLTRGVSMKKTLPDILRHEELGGANQAWWDPIQMQNHVQRVSWPTVHVTAHWDIFSGHQIAMFNALRQGSSSGPNAHSLIVGPLGHCMLGNLDAELSIQEARGLVNGFGLASEMFSGHQGSFHNRLGRINVYMQGSRRDGRRGPGKVGDFWTSLNEWPKTRSTKLLLTKNHGLALFSDHKQAEENQHVQVSRRLRSLSSVDKKNSKQNAVLASLIGSGYEEFIYNPVNAQGTNGGNNLVIMYMGFGCGSEDQSRVESRQDVLVFDTPEPLSEPLALLGPMRASLWVSTNRNDTDFHVSVTDVHPDGASMQIRFGLQRMRWRESTPLRSVSSTTEPGIVYNIHVDMWWTGYIVAPDHRLRVTISSSNTPYYAKNDNSGSDVLGFKMELEAKNRVYYSVDTPSYVELPVVDLSDIPRNDKF